MPCEKPPAVTRNNKGWLAPSDTPVPERTIAPLVLRSLRTARTRPASLAGIL